MTIRDTYSITADGLTAAVAELVKQLRTQDPSLGKFRGKLWDGSIVTIVVGKGPIGTKNEDWKMEAKP